MPNARLLAALDGGPHDDPREAEEKELLEDGQDEEDAKNAVKDEDSKDVKFEDWAEEDEDKKPAKEPAMKEEPEEKKPVKAEEKEEKEEDKEADKEKDIELDEEGKVKVSEGEEVEVKEELKSKTIPYERFRKELAKRHGQALTIQELRQELNAVKAAQQKQSTVAEEAADPKPDQSLDPLGYANWQIRQLAAEVKRMQAPAAAPATISAEEIATLQELYVDSAKDYAAEHPDFAGKDKDGNLTGAYGHAVAVTNRFINANYPQATPGQKEAIFQQMEMSAVRNAIRAGQDPAEAIVQFAVQNGYKPPTGKTAGSKETEKQNDVKERVLDAAADAARRRRATSVAGAGKTVSRRPLTEGDIDGMSNAELERFMRSNSGTSDPLRA